MSGLEDHAKSKKKVVADVENAVSVVVPAFDEGRRIRQSLQIMIRYLETRFEAFEILVVDDGSTDSTVSEVEKIGHPALRCLRNVQNRGKGFSVRRGMLEALHPYVLFTDADLSTPFEELEKLLEALRSGQDVAIASRWCEAGQDVRRGLLRNFQGRAFAFVVHLIALRGFRDTQCGFKMFRRAAAQEIFSRTKVERWGFDVEALYLAQKWNLGVSEIPVRWIQSDESKLRLTAPFSMLCDLLRIRWNDICGLYRRPSPSPVTHPTES